MNQPPPTIEQKLRDGLLDAVAFRIGVEVETAMPADIPSDIRKAILSEVLPNSRFELSRLSTDELQNDRCVDYEIERAVEVARQFIVRVRKQRSRS